MPTHSPGAVPGTLYYGKIDGVSTEALFLGKRRDMKSEGQPHVYILAVPCDAHDEKAREVPLAAGTQGTVATKLVALKTIVQLRRTPKQSIKYASWIGPDLERARPNAGQVMCLLMDVEALPIDTGAGTVILSDAEAEGDGSVPSKNPETAAELAAQLLAPVEEEQEPTAQPENVTAVIEQILSQHLQPLGDRLQALEARGTEAQRKRGLSLGAPPAVEQGNADDLLNALRRDFGGRDPRGRMPEPSPRTSGGPPMLPSMGRVEAEPEAAPDHSVAEAIKQMGAVIAQSLRGRGLDEIDVEHGSTEETLVGTTGGRGMEKKARLDKKFDANPYPKYAHVVQTARRTCGLTGSGRNDAELLKLYFKDHVAIGKFKFASHVLEMVSEIHNAYLKQQEDRVLGLLGGFYQLLEQYTVDQGDLYVGWMATHLPEVGPYAATPSEEAVGKLLEREIAVAATAYQKDLDALKKFRDARRKK